MHYVTLVSKTLRSLRSPVTRVSVHNVELRGAGGRVWQDRSEGLKVLKSVYAGQAIRLAVTEE